MLGPLLLLSALLFAPPDWSIYSTTKQVHAGVKAVAQRNSGVAEARRHGIAATDVYDESSAAAAGFGSWMQALWAREVKPGAALQSVFVDSPADPPVQILQAHSPHTPDAPLSMELGDADSSGALLRSLLHASTPASSSSLTDNGAAHGGSTPLRVLLNFGEHGREIISSEVALRFLAMLDIARNEALQRRDGDGDDAPLTGDADTLASPLPPSTPSSWSSALPPVVDLAPLHAAWLLTHARLTLVPLLNSWSHEQIEQGQLCQRKSRGGVDLNRNWDFLWEGPPEEESGGSVGDILSAQRARRQRQRERLALQDEQYPGPRAFSEPESRTLRDVARATQPDLYVNIHSGIQEMYCGWDHRAALTPNGAEQMRLLHHLAALDARRACPPPCPVGGAGAIGGYLVFGGSMDWVYSALNSSYALTLEVFGGEDSPNGSGVSPRDCVGYFNPRSRDLLDQTSRNWGRILVAAVGFAIGEKKGVGYPWGKEEWMTSSGSGGDSDTAAAASSTTAAAGAAGVGQAENPSSTPAAAHPPHTAADAGGASITHSNHYARMTDLLKSLKSSTSSSSSSSSSKSQWRWEEGTGASPFAPPATATAEGSDDSFASSASSWASAWRRRSSIPALQQPVPSWNDACTPFLPALPPSVVGRLERQGSRVALPLLRFPGAEEAESDGAALNVLVLAGTFWNDLLSTQLVCSWIEQAESSMADELQIQKGKRQLHLWLLPSLFASFRSMVLESPASFPGTCSALLSSASRLHVLAHQLYATEGLLGILRRVRSHVVLEVLPEKFDAAASAAAAASSSAAAGGASFMHVEAIPLRSDGLATNTLREALAHSIGTGAEGEAAAAAAVPAGRLSWSVRPAPPPPPPTTTATATATSTASSPSDDEASLQCQVGRVDLLGLLRAEGGGGLQQHCPSCQLMLRLYAHGSDASSSEGVPPPNAPAPTAATATAVAPDSASAAEASAHASAQAQWLDRSHADLLHPAEWVRPSDEATHATPAGLGARSVVMAPAAPGATDAHWCDFNLRNLPAHTHERVLQLHVEQSTHVFTAIRRALGHMAEMDAFDSGSTSTSVSAPPQAHASFERPPFRRLTPDEVQAHFRRLTLASAHPQPGSYARLHAEDALPSHTLLPAVSVLLWQCGLLVALAVCVGWLLLLRRQRRARTRATCGPAAPSPKYVYRRANGLTIRPP